MTFIANPIIRYAMDFPTLALTGLICYLIGSIPFGAIFAAVGANMDIRKVGSGNIGATNVARALGVKTGLLTLFLDAMKGVVPLLVIRTVVTQSRLDLFLAVGGVMIVIGHLFSAYLRFSGGKGVATTLGVFLVLAPEAVGLAALVFLVVVCATRYVSLGSILAALALPPAVFLTAESGSYFRVSLIVSLLVLIKHRANIRRLLAGEENRFGRSAS